ncbi:hypothetical protein C8039_14495 [Halogeometricum sp. wsp3]|nr:hypothetical protein C8039_14495 [Halogeometricum sp. wsp3]
MSSPSTSGFDDLQGARDIAPDVADGADIVFHRGWMRRCRVSSRPHRLMSGTNGVDTDQSRSNPRYSDDVLASIVKRVNVAVYDAATRLSRQPPRGADVSLD